MKKKLFLLPLVMFALAACGGGTTEGGGGTGGGGGGTGGGGGGTEPKAAVTLNAKNVLGYDGTANVNYGDGSQTVDGVTVSWVGVGCYGQDNTTKEWDADGFFQCRNKNEVHSIFNFSCENTIKDITIVLALRKSNYDATKPLYVDFGVDTVASSNTVNFVKDEDTIKVDATAGAKKCKVEYDVNDGYTYSIYIDHFVISFAD